LKLVSETVSILFVWTLRHVVWLTDQKLGSATFKVVGCVLYAVSFLNIVICLKPFILHLLWFGTNIIVIKRKVHIISPCEVCEQPAVFWHLLSATICRFCQGCWLPVNSWYACIFVLLLVSHHHFLETLLQVKIKLNSWCKSSGSIILALCVTCPRLCKKSCSSYCYRVVLDESFQCASYL